MTIVRGTDHGFASFRLFDSEFSARGHTGATNSVRHIGPPRYERVSDFTNVGDSPPSNPNVRIGRLLPQPWRHESGDAPDLNLDCVMQGLAAGSGEGKRLFRLDC